MKKLLFALIIFLPSICFAQTYIGLKTAYSPLSTISFMPDIKAKSISGTSLDYGVVVKNYNNKWAGFQGELYFTQRGYKAPFKDSYMFKRVNSYIELPIFFQLHVGYKGVYIHLNAGCYAAYLLSAKEGVDTTGSMVLKKVDFNILRDNRFDYGLMGGLGLSYESKWGMIQVEVRIQRGFADLYKYDYEYDDMPDESKAVVQNFNISYMYNLDKLFKKSKPVVVTP